MGVSHVKSHEKMKEMKGMKMIYDYKGDGRGREDVYIYKEVNHV